LFDGLSKKGISVDAYSVDIITGNEGADGRGADGIGFNFVGGCGNSGPNETFFFVFFLNVSGFLIIEE